MDNKAKYDMEYAKTKLKRIPLDVQKEQYEIIKSHADSLGKPINTFIKELIFKEIGI